MSKIGDAMLTPRQLDILAFIYHNLQASGVVPSYWEIADGTKTADAGGVYHFIIRLERRGYIKRTPYSHRTLEITDKTREMSEELTAHAKSKKLTLRPNHAKNHQ